MTTSKKIWIYKPKITKESVPELTKKKIEIAGNTLVDSILKKNFIKPKPKNPKFNYIGNIFTKWNRNYFYFCATYFTPPGSPIESFETRFARLEYMGVNQFNLSYMRHTGTWWELERNISLQKALNLIGKAGHYYP